MKVYTRIEYQMTDAGLNLIREESFDYSGPVALAKGDSEAKKREQEQFAQQKKYADYQFDQMNKLNGAFSGFLDGEHGYSPEMLAALNSKALDDNASAYNNSGTQLRLALQRSGGGGAGLPMSGSGVRGLATLMAARAGDEGNALRNIRLADAQQKITNQFNAGSLMSGNAAALSSPISSFTSGANSALDAYLKSQTTGFVGSFKSAFGSSLGKGLGSLASGGVGGMVGGEAGYNAALSGGRY